MNSPLVQSSNSDILLEESNFEFLGHIFAGSNQTETKIIFDTTSDFTFFIDPDYLDKFRGNMYDPDNSTTSLDLPDSTKEFWYGYFFDTYLEGTGIKDDICLQ